jgi:hypothetical protein
MNPFPQFLLISLHIRDDAQEINVAGGSRDAIELCDYEAATAVQIDILR